MLVTTFAFTLTIAIVQATLMWQDPEARSLGVTLRGLCRISIWPGWFRRLVPAYLAYFRRDFHPWDRPAPDGFEVQKRAIEGDVVRA
jgi:predicted metal-dependent hydrolase